LVDRDATTQSTPEQRQAPGAATVLVTSGSSAAGTSTVAVGAM
jgi:hypothetical protein